MRRVNRVNLWRMKKWMFLSLALLFLTAVPAELAAQAGTAAKSTPVKLTPEKAKELAQACRNLLLLTDEGLEHLEKLTHGLADLNKQYHRDRDVWETAWGTLNRLATRYDQVYAKWSAQQKPCDEETDLAMGTKARMLLPWEKVRSPFEKVWHFEAYKDQLEMRERKRWGRNIPACIEAERIYNAEVGPTLAALKEPEDAYYEMAKQYEKSRREYEDAYNDYRNIMLVYFWGPAENVAKIAPPVVDDFNHVKTQFPKMDDYFSSETLFGYLIKIQDAKKKADILCRERLALPPPPPPDPRIGEAEAAIGKCDFDKAKALIGQLPAGPGRTRLEKQLNEAIAREDRVRKLWDEAAQEYTKAQTEDKAGHLPQSRAAYERTLQKLDAAKNETKCDHRKKQIGLSRGIVSDRLDDLSKPVRPEWLSDAEAKAFIQQLDVQYRQKWLRKWCPTTRTNCAIVPTDVWGGLYNRAWWARTREKQGIVRKIAACIDPCVMDVAMKAGDRDAKIKKCYADNPIPR
jgi:hypothetical protein